MATNDTIIQRIGKLLAVQEGRGATEAEAALAAEHVQRLLQDHNLTLAEVEAAGGSSDTGGRREKTALNDRAVSGAWSRRLMESLAENNFCLHTTRKVFTPSNHPKASKYAVVDGVRTRGYERSVHILVGRTLNIRVTQDTYDYLVGAVERALLDSGHNDTYQHRLWFRDGAAVRLSERLNQKRREAEKESRQKQAQGNGTGRELVLADVYGTEADLNNDALCGFPPGTTAADRREGEERSARNQQRHDELVAQGVDSDEAWYRALGYGDEQAAALAAQWRRGHGGRRGRGRSQSWSQTDNAKYRKQNSGAYQSGLSAGASIGLDGQVGATKRRQITRS